MADPDEFLVKDASGNVNVPADPTHPELGPDPWGFGSRIVPGHPLYAQVEGERVIAEVLGQILRPATAELAARSIIAQLVRHDPPIYLCTAAEMKES